MQATEAVRYTYRAERQRQFGSVDAFEVLAAFVGDPPDVRVLIAIPDVSLGGELQQLVLDILAFAITGPISYLGHPKKFLVGRPEYGKDFVRRALLGPSDHISNTSVTDNRLLIINVAHTVINGVYKAVKTKVDTYDYPSINNSGGSAHWFQIREPGRSPELLG